MRNQALYAIVAMAALFFVNGCQKPVVEPPTLKLDTTEFSAKAEGEVVSVPYTLTNGVEGSDVDVKPAADYDWAEFSGISADAISIRVDRNDSEEPRTAEFSVSYPGVSKDLSFKINQAAGAAPAPEYDYECEMTEFYIEAAPEEGLGGEDEYMICLSDKSMASGDFLPGGTYYAFDLYLPSGTEPIPAGDYPIGAPGETAAMTVAQSDWTYYRVEGDPGVELALVSGNLSISVEGDIYTFDAVVTDEAGDVHHVSYTGSIVPEEPEPGEYDYEFEMTEFFAYYYDDYGLNGEINYYTWISDLPFSDDGYTQVGGNYYLFDIFAAPGSGHAIPAGTYTLGEYGATDAGTFTSDYSKYLYQGDGETIASVEAFFTEGVLENS